MRRKILLFTISIWAFLNVNAHSPNNDNVVVYIDNILVGKISCVDFNKIPSILLKNYYCECLLQCSSIEFLDKAPSSKLNPKKIKKLFIEYEDEDLLRRPADLHIHTTKAKDGYLFVNKSILDRISYLGSDWTNLKISYMYNNRAVTTKKDVMQIIGLRKKRIKIVEILQDEQSGVLTVYIIAK